MRAAFMYGMREHVSFFVDSIQTIHLAALVTQYKDPLVHVVITKASIDFDIIFTLKTI